MRINNERLLELAREGRTYAEMEGALGLTEKQVSSALYRMRQAGIDIPKRRDGAKHLAMLEDMKQGYRAMPRRRRRRLEPFSARLDADILAAIKRVARRLGISQAVIVEDAVQFYLEQKGLAK